MARNPKIKQVSSHNFDQLLRRPKDDRELPAKEKTFETNVSKFFLERATISIFFFALQIKIIYVSMSRTIRVF